MKDKGRLIRHLTKEIETVTETMMTFRARCNFAIFVGPLVLLGSVMIATHQIPHGLTLNASTIVASGLIILSYITMGTACARIEIHSWQQCNNWRQLIVRLTNDPDATVSEKELLCKYQIGLGYGVTYAAMVVGFLCVIYLTTHLNIPSTPNP